jgi:hypothetical protein
MYTERRKHMKGEYIRPENIMLQIDTFLEFLVIARNTGILTKDLLPRKEHR